MLLSECLREFVDKNMKKHLFLNHFHSVDLGQSNHPSHHPIDGVPGAQAKGQHDSRPAARMDYGKQTATQSAIYGIGCPETFRA